MAGDAEDAGATIAVKRLDDDVAVLLAEGGDAGTVAGDEGGRVEFRELGDQQLLRRVAHADRIVDHQGFRMDTLEQMRRGDVGEVEGRVLAEQHDVESGEIDEIGRPQGEVVALVLAHRDRLDGRPDMPIAHCQTVGCVVIEEMAALLGLEHQRKGRIAADDDPRDMVHLDGDFEGHLFGFRACFPASGAGCHITPHLRRRTPQSCDAAGDGARK